MWLALLLYTRLERFEISRDMWFFVFDFLIACMGGRRRMCMEIVDK
jgi:hypothetical protein